LSRALESQPYRILQASKVDDAFELLAMHHVDVVMADQQMPGMTGLEFLEKVQQMYPKVVRMMLSGYAEQRILLNAINTGTVFKFLCKPCEEEQLFSALEDAFVKAASVR
jgi:YesN/AraC family two-component response regulator